MSKINRYKLKDGVTKEDLILAGFREGGTWINKEATLFYEKTFFLKKCKFEISIGLAINTDTMEFDDFNNILVLDEDFCQPYTPFYGENYGKKIKDFPALEWAIDRYNETLDSLLILENIIV